MSEDTGRLRIGYIPLVDAAHLLAPVAIASSLGLGHVRVPIAVPFNLNLNGNAITVTHELFEALRTEADGGLADPMVSARALARLAARRKRAGEEPLAFGMTFPFSNHNYQLRFWMAAGGVDPDEDVRLVVLPPPYMVDSLAKGHVQGFCVGAPWNAVAVEQGFGRILHFGTDIVARASEKVFAVRDRWAAENAGTLQGLVRALGRASALIDDPAGRDEAAALLAAPARVNVPAEMIRRTLDGRLRIAPGVERTDPRYLLAGDAAATRPDPVQAAWIYAQMVRWGQTALSPEGLATAKAVFRPDLYDAALGTTGGAADGVGAFAGPEFDPDDPAAHLLAWRAANP